MGGPCFICNMHSRAALAATPGWETSDMTCLDQSCWITVLFQATTTSHACHQDVHNTTAFKSTFLPGFSPCNTLYLFSFSCPIHGFIDTVPRCVQSMTDIHMWVCTTNPDYYMRYLTGSGKKALGLRDRSYVAFDPNIGGNQTTSWSPSGPNGVQTKSNLIYVVSLTYC